MSHQKPAPASVTATDFSPADSPLDLTLLRQHDQGSSLMERAQRRLATSDAIFARAHALREQAATSALPQEAQLAALDRQSGQLADAERAQAGYRRLRERYDPGEVERSLQVIAAIPDPVRQRESLTQLQASYAAFAFNPEIAQRLDRQFADFEPVVQRREGAALRAAILAGRYAPTLADARQIYPGRKINTMLAPGSDRPLFVPTKFADPDLEAEAVQVIQNAFHLAQVTGKRSHLEAALDDEAVRQVSRIPGNQASVVFERAMEAFPAMPLVPDAHPAGIAAPTDDGGTLQSDAPPDRELKIGDFPSDDSTEKALAGAAIGLGQELHLTGLLREEYHEAIKPLLGRTDPEGKAMREAIQLKYRELQTAYGQEQTKIILAKKAARDAALKAAGIEINRKNNAGKSNPQVDEAAKRTGRLGRNLKILGVAGEALTIATAPEAERPAEIKRAGGRMAGAWAGSALGAEIGAAGGPVGAIVGATIGGIVGSFGGEQLIDGVFHGPPSPPKPHPRLK